MAERRVGSKVLGSAKAGLCEEAAITREFTRGTKKSGDLKSKLFSDGFALVSDHMTTVHGIPAQGFMPIFSVTGFLFGPGMMISPTSQRCPLTWDIQLGLNIGARKFKPMSLAHTRPDSPFFYPSQPSALRFEEVRSFQRNFNGPAGNRDQSHSARRRRKYR